MVQTLDLDFLSELLSTYNFCCYRVEKTREQRRLFYIWLFIRKFKKKYFQVLPRRHPPLPSFWRPPKQYPRFRVFTLQRLIGHTTGTLVLCVSTRFGTRANVQHKNISIRMWPSRGASRLRFRTGPQKHYEFNYRVFGLIDGLVARVQWKSVTTRNSYGIYWFVRRN